MEAKNDGKHDGLLTERQWAKKGYLINENALGVKLWANAFHQDVCTYYSLDEVHPATEVELNEYWRPERERKKLSSARSRQRSKDALEKERQDFMDRIWELQDIIRNLYAAVLSLSEMMFEEPQTFSKVVVLDTETTGLSCVNDEILELSIISGTGEILYSGRFRPLVAKSWDEAEKINGISFNDVKDCPFIYEEIGKINGILSHAETIVAYNASFDLGFLRNAGAVIPPNAHICDVMLDFAEVYGEYSEYFMDYKWQKLVTCACYYGYDWKDDEAHSSLADAKATLYCYQKMLGH